LGHDSCNGPSAWHRYGNAERFVATTALSIIGNRSCNGDEACTSAGSQGPQRDRKTIRATAGEAACLGGGQLGGARYIGNKCLTTISNIGASHNTCLFIGDLGHAVIGNGSCNGSSACTFTGQFGANSVIGVNSCNGLGACFDAGQGPFPGTGDFQSASAIGNGSCNAEAACQFVGINGSSSIGNTSCNNLVACEFAGSFNTGSTIGNHSCNGASRPERPRLSNRRMRQQRGHHRQQQAEQPVAGVFEIQPPARRPVLTAPRRVVLARMARQRFSAPRSRINTAPPPARMARRLAVREDVVPVRRATCALALEHRLAIGRGESLAVDHAHATQPAAARFEQEVGERVARFLRREARAGRARPARSSGRGAAW
jgi:hypothetical protein